MHDVKHSFQVCQLLHRNECERSGKNVPKPIGREWQRIPPCGRQRDQLLTAITFGASSSKVAFAEETLEHSAHGYIAYAHQVAELPLALRASRVGCETRQHQQLCAGQVQGTEFPVDGHAREP